MDNNPLNLPPALLDIHLGVERGARVTVEQAQMLLDYEDILSVAAMADAVAERKWARRTFYSQPLRIAVEALCEGECSVCPPDVIEHAASARPAELHLVNLPLRATLPEVERMLTRLRERLPETWIQGFSPHELRRLAGDGDLDAVAVRLQQAGLDGLLGTHEEAYTRKGRQLLADETLDFDDALAAHGAAHRAGLVSVATLDYRPGESSADLAARLDAIRETQRKSAGFSVFAPQPRNIHAGQLQRETPSGYEDMRLLAVGRLFFDNIPHIRVPWLALGLKMGQVALSFGADDLGWAALDPHVRRYAPSTAFCSLTVGEIERAMLAARRRPTHVDGAFRERVGMHA